jgi:hypothetical protein
MMLNNITIPTRILTTILIIGILGSGCKKSLDIESTHLVNEANNWKSITDTRSALLGTYGLLRAAMADNNGHWLYGELRDGDFKASSRLDLKAIIGGNLNAPYPVLQSLSNWRRFYAVINSATLFIDRAHEVLEKDKQYTERNYQVDIAQMRALRAFTYFYISRIWGDVPLVTAGDGNFENVHRSPKAEVLGYAEAEMLKAANDLPYRYGDVTDPLLPGLYYGENSSSWSGVLFTRVSAYAVLAHIAAWNEKYIDASGYVIEALDNGYKAGAFALTTASMTKSDGLFYGKQSAQIFGLSFSWADRESTTTGHIEDLTLAAPLVTKLKPQIFVPDETVLGIFNENNDERFSIDPTTGRAKTDYFVNFGSSNTVFSKIKCIRNASSDGSLALFSSSIVFTRMEELILLYAESMAALGNTSSAIEALNAMRLNRGLIKYGGNNDGVVDAIFQERRRELMGEGWRWYDLVRYNRIKRNNPDFNKLIDNNGIFWPINEDVLNRNSLLIQNNYWR